MRQEEIAQPSEQVLDAQYRMEVFPAESAVSGLRILVQLRLGRERHQSLVEDQAHDDAHGERATAEAEAEDFVVVGLVVAADEFIEVDDVTLETPTKRTAQ